MLTKIQFLNKDILHESYYKPISYNTDTPQNQDCPCGPGPQGAPSSCGAPGKKEGHGFAEGLVACSFPQAA